MDETPLPLTKKVSKVIISVVTVILGLIVIFLGSSLVTEIIRYQQVQSVWGPVPGNLSFDFENCNHASPDFAPTIEKLEKSTSGTLHIKIAVPVNCAQNGGLGNYIDEKNNILHLQYIEIKTAGEAACFCKAILNYTIKGYSQSDFSIKLTKLGSLHEFYFLPDEKILLQP